MSPDELTFVLSRLDAGMEQISKMSLPGTPAALASPVVTHAEQLGRKALRVLYLTGIFQDLPEDARLDPRVQERVRRAMPEMDEAVLGMAGLLKQTSPAERAGLKQALQERPELVDQIGEALDSGAGSADIPMKRRLHLRRIIKHVAWRMQRQSPTAVIEEYTDKVGRMAERHGAPEQLQRALVAQAAGQLLWDGEAGARMDLAPDGFGSGDGEPEPSGTAALTAGGIMLGFGVLTGLASYAIVLSGGFAGVFGITLGVVTIIAGLVFLLVGAVQRAGDP